MRHGRWIAVSTAVVGAAGISLVLIAQHNKAMDEDGRYPKHYANAVDCLVISRVPGAQANVENVCEADVAFEYEQSQDQERQRTRLGYGLTLTLLPTVQVVRACFISSSEDQCSITGPYESDTPKPPDLRLPENQIHSSNVANIESDESIQTLAPLSDDQEDEAQHPTVNALAGSEGINFAQGEVDYSRVCQFIANHNPLVEARSPDALSVQCYCDEKGDLDKASECTMGSLPPDVASHCAKHPTWCFGRADPMSIQVVIVERALQKMGINTDAIASRLDQARNGLNRAKKRLKTFPKTSATMRRRRCMTRLESRDSPMMGV